MTGIGERAHLASSSVDLSTHVNDVLGTIQYERLSGFVLVGHSYGGMVVTAVADRVPEKVHTLVYLDAFVPKDGQSLLDLARPEMRERILALRGWQVPPPPPQGMTNKDEIAWIEDRRNPQPAGTFKEKIVLKNKSFPNRVYVFCSGYSPTTFAPFGAATKADKAWRYHELPTHHYPQISMPRELAAILTS